MRIATITGCFVGLVLTAAFVDQPVVAQTAVAQATTADVPKQIAKDLTAWDDHPWSRLPPLRFVKVTERLQQSKKRWTEADIMPAENAGGVTLASESARTWDGYTGNTFRTFLGFFRLSGTVESSRVNRFQYAQRFTKLKRLEVPAGVPEIAGVDPQDLAVEFEFETLLSGSSVTAIVDTTVVGSGPREVQINGEAVTLDCYTLTHRVRGKNSGGYAKIGDIGYYPQPGFYTDYRWEIFAQFRNFVEVTLQFEVTSEQLAALKAGQ
jgi:hypothetical protein